jgi:kynureninase
LVASPREPDRRGGTVILDIENGHEIVTRLAERNVLEHYRPGAGIRIATHFYTSDEELDVTIREIDSLIGPRRLTVPGVS